MLTFRISLNVLSVILLIRSAFVRGFRTTIPQPNSVRRADKQNSPEFLSILWSGGRNSEDGISNKPSKEAALREEAQVLLDKAEALRKQLPVRSLESPTTNELEPRASQWNVPPIDDDLSNESTGYRLHVDIGREDGTWMDPRWGASQRRIEFTIDVLFQRLTNVTEQQQKCMVPDNFGGTSSPTYNLRIAPYARLRNGFDDMKCHVDNGAYRIDTQNGNRTIRFYITTDGKTNISYGDIHIPAGELYFSLPCFGNNDVNAVRNLSTKHGIVSIRQSGWHTGWRRMESRILGTFRATPIAIANNGTDFKNSGVAFSF